MDPVQSVEKGVHKERSCFNSERGGIDPHSGGWDEVRGVFNPADAHCILQIPLCSGEMEDIVAWQHTKTGIFTVRSAYYVEREH